MPACLINEAADSLVVDQRSSAKQLTGGDYVAYM